MKADDTQRSVRVEVDGVQPGSVGAPELDRVQPGAPTWLTVGFALLVIALVGAFLFAVQPTRDATATPDGAVGDVTPDDAGESIDVERASIVLGESDPANAPDELRPTNLDLDWDVDSIVATETGLFALEDAASPSTTPPIFLSGNGRDWLPVNSEVTLFDGVLELQFTWSRLTRTDSGFAVTASSSRDGTQRTDLFVSSDGGNWEQVEGFGLLANAATTPVFVRDDLVIGMTPVGGREINEFLAAHTNIGATSICDNFSDNDPLLLITCDGRRLRLGANNVASERPTVEVLQCATRLARVGFGATPVVGSVLDRSSGESEPMVLLQGAIDLTRASPRSETLAFLDFGVIDTEVLTGQPEPQLPDDVCEGLAEIPELGEPAVVVYAPNTDGVTRLPFPNDGISTNPVNVSVIGVLDSGDRQTAVVQRPGGAVWVVDVETGQWSFIGGANSLGREVVGIADSGDRIYQMNADELFVLDLEFGEQGLARVDAAVVPFVGAFRGFDRILHATRDIVFFNDDSDTWMLDTSELGVSPSR